LDARPPLEAQLIDPADEIAYNCADLDDGYEAKLLTLPLIRQRVRLFDSLYRAIDRKFPSAREKLKFNEALKAVLNILVTDLIDTTRERLAEARTISVRQVCAHPRRLVGLGPRRARDNQELKEFLNENLYSHRQVGSEREVIVRCVRRLFGYYLEHPRRLPPFYVAQSREEPLHRVVCDYIAGMTDNYLLTQYRKHLG
jgi:dGTPase